MRLLLDAHLSLILADRLVAEGFDVATLEVWRGGLYRHSGDDEILASAALDERVLVTYDVHSIQPLLKEWGVAGQHHAGVVLIDHLTIQQADIGGQIRALRALILDQGDLQWDDRVIYLPPHRRA